MEKKRAEAPRARSEGLIVQRLAGELLIYDRERHQAHCLNSTAAWVFQHSDGRSSIDEIAARMSLELNASVDRALVVATLEQLSSRHLLEPPVEGDALAASADSSDDRSSRSSKRALS